MVRAVLEFFGAEVSKNDDGTWHFELQPGQTILGIIVVLWIAAVIIASIKHALG